MELSVANRGRKGSEVDTESQAAHREGIRRQFGASAPDYVSSTGHARGADLQILVEWAEGGTDKRLLDIATGGGHTALALSSTYGVVVASDITDEMLRVAEEFTRSKSAGNVEFAVADAESLPFPDGSFDAVSCRIAPHHFPEPGRFVNESFRVLRPGGIFLLVDSVAPADPYINELLNHVERLRDPTHVLTLTEREWLDLLEAAGFAVEAIAHDHKAHDLEGWMDRSRTPPDQRTEIKTLLARSSPAARSELLVTFDQAGECTGFTDTKLLVKARRRE